MFTSSLTGPCTVTIRPKQSAGVSWTSTVSMSLLADNGAADDGRSCVGTGAGPARRSGAFSGVGMRKLAPIDSFAATFAPVGTSAWSPPV
ncbi:MAG: hypothetical protein ACR2KL_05380 [Nocardioidaceae bacterium]